MSRGSQNLVSHLAILSFLLWTAESGRASAQGSTQGTLSGTVVDVVGGPVTGVRIRLSRETYSGNAPDFYLMVPVNETVVKVDGSFSFDAPAGPYTLQLVPPRDRSSAWVAAPVSILLTAGQLTAARVEARKGGFLEIAVTEAGTSKPLAQARMDIEELDRSWRTAVVSDAGGVARVLLMPGRYEVRQALCEGHTYEGQPEAVTITAETTQQVVMSLTPNIHGIVRGPEGAPVAGARIRIVGAGREEVTSDERGRYEIAWDRRCQFRAAAVFCLVARQEEQNLAARLDISRDASLLDINLQRGAVLTGRVVDPDGKEIGGAWVAVTLDVPNWGDTPLCEEQTRADSDGRFEVRGVPPAGQYTLHAHADTYGSKDVVTSTPTSAGRPLDVGALTLGPASLAVSGRVLDLAGNPVAHALIYGWGDGQPLRLNTETDTQGRFSLAGVCVGKVDLRVDADMGGGKRLWARVRADAGDEIEIDLQGPFGG